MLSGLTCASSQNLPFSISAEVAGAANVVVVDRQNRVASNHGMTRYPHQSECMYSAIAAEGELMDKVPLEIYFLRYSSGNHSVRAGWSRRLTNHVASHTRRPRFGMVASSYLASELSRDDQAEQEN